jgi:hypothetical protein
MKYGKILMVTTVIISFAFQACAQSDPLGESRSSGAMGSSGDYLNPNMGQMSRDKNPDDGVSGMVQWLDQPVTNDVNRSTTTKTRSAPGPYAAKSTTTTTSTSPASESTSTTTETTTSSTPGFDAIFAVAGLLAVTYAKASHKE